MLSVNVSFWALRPVIWATPGDWISRNFLQIATLPRAGVGGSQVGRVLVLRLDHGGGVGQAGQVGSLLNRDGPRERQGILQAPWFLCRVGNRGVVIGSAPGASLCLTSSLSLCSPHRPGPSSCATPDRVSELHPLGKEWSWTGVWGRVGQWLQTLCSDEASAGAHCGGLFLSFAWEPVA